MEPYLPELVMDDVEIQAANEELAELDQDLTVAEIEARKLLMRDQHDQTFKKLKLYRPSIGLAAERVRTNGATRRKDN